MNPRNSLQPITHPAVIGALLLWVINDHVLKARYDNWWTGKLSDIAGMIVFPCFIAALLDTNDFVRTRMSPRQTLVLSSTITALAFTTVKLTPQGAWLYQWGLGLAQWPMHALQAGAWINVRPVHLTMDVSDLLALPFVLVPMWLSYRSRTNPGEALRRSGLIASGRGVLDLSENYKKEMTDSLTKKL